MAYLTILLIVFLALIISAIPLHLAVVFFRGKSTLLKVIIVNFIAAITISYIESRLGIFGGFVSFIALLFIYKFMFGLGLLRVFFVWVLQGVIAIVLVFLLVLALGFFGISAIF